jgi:SAM-dependent methyltransferase
MTSDISTNEEKGEAELAFWRGRQEAEGVLRHGHYERFYTTQFELTPENYAGKRVLDIGCGPRGSLEWAVEALERVGLDPLVHRYRDLGIDDHQTTYVEAGAEEIPFRDGHFDIVAVFNALDHVEDTDAAIAEMTRVTRAGGIGLVIVEVNHEPTPTEPQSLEWEILERFTGWDVVMERRTGIDARHDVYGSWQRQEQSEQEQPGIVGARLRKREGC